MPQPRSGLSSETASYHLLDTPGSCGALPAPTPSVTCGSDVRTRRLAEGGCRGCSTKGSAPACPRSCAAEGLSWEAPLRDGVRCTQRPILSQSEPLNDAGAVADQINRKRPAIASLPPHPTAKRFSPNTFMSCRTLGLRSSYFSIRVKQNSLPMWRHAVPVGRNIHMIKQLPIPRGIKGICRIGDFFICVLVPHYPLFEKRVGLKTQMRDIIFDGNDIRAVSQKICRSRPHPRTKIR